MPNRMSWIGACALSLTASAVLSEDTSLGGLQTRVVGQWQSIACELRPGPNPEGAALAPVPTYLKRDFTYASEGDFSANITVFADAACAAPLVRYDFAGEIDWHEENPAAPGAWSQDYHLNRELQLTVLAEPMADQLDALPEGACGNGPFVVGQTRDILGEPCVLLHFVDGAQYVTDHDFLYIREDAPHLLFMGGKHVDGTGFYFPENRPIVGMQQPLLRVQ